MDRREFIQMGAAGASGLIVLAGVDEAAVPKLPGSRPRPIPLPDMDTYLARVDEGMESISRWSPSSAFPSFGGDRAAVDGLARKSLRSLYMSAMFADLPESGQQHPEMQNRVFDVMPEMDEATSGMAAFLSTRSPSELEDLQVMLRHRANPSMEIFEALDRDASALGVSSQRRLQTRVMMTQASWRLRNQPPSLVIHETLDKVEKLVATDASDEARIDWVAGRAGEEIFWGQQQQAGTILEKEGKRRRDDGRSTRQRRLASGAKILGIGIVVGALGAAGTAAGALPLVFVATVGVVMILIGLIVLLVGLLTPGERSQ